MTALFDGRPKNAVEWINQVFYLILMAELHVRASVAPYLNRCGNLPIREILVIKWPYARPFGILFWREVAYPPASYEAETTKESIETFRFYDENDYEYDIFSILSVGRAWGSVILGGKRGSRRHSTTSFSKNVEVAETSYKRLEVIAFFSREKSKPPSITTTVLTFLVKKSTMKNSGVSILWQYAKKL